MELYDLADIINCSIYYSGLTKTAADKKGWANFFASDPAAFSVPGYTKLYISTTNNNWRGILAGGTESATVGTVPKEDLILTYGPVLRHEQSHRNSGNTNTEAAAYAISLQVLTKIGPGAFINKEYFKENQTLYQTGAGIK